MDSSKMQPVGGPIKLDPHTMSIILIILLIGVPIAVIAYNFLLPVEAEDPGYMAVIHKKRVSSLVGGAVMEMACILVLLVNRFMV